MSDHRITIHQDPRNVRAVCKCGWKGTRYQARRLAGYDNAQAESNIHVATAK